ncbi:acyl-CoA synthetase [Yinghuangia sp. ASG 101]|uniref:acyl-CoA synthetase n=1 Tax=Yinghuangia sp. ASG 101 TaxID=2896848 RepID=UPI001E4DE9CD|nr:acyl-CoA synthetase [Yinghuangia sp. ASG 101]UGQ13630.1 acyl-CoA synthetase [Yinghuangia sp. ASG 101]
MFPGTYARTTPDKPAVVMAASGVGLTYRELDENSARLAHLLRDAGLRPGDGIALLADNNVRCFEVYWAALRSGLYITAVNHHLTADEVAYIVDDCGARVLVASAAVGDLAEAIVARTPNVRIRLAFDGPVAGHGDYLRAVEPFPTTAPEAQPNGADMLYSSGTTGRPKGIRRPLADRRVDEPGEQIVTVFARPCGFDTDTVYLSPAPFYHAAPLRFLAMVHRTGGTAVVMERFDAEAALAAIERHRVTHTQWVPTMFVRALKLPPEARTRYDLSSLRVAIHGAAPCPADVKRAMIDWWGPILLEYYSSTEANGTTLIDSAQWLAKPGSVGRPLLGVVRVCGDDGIELPTGATGTIYFERETQPFAYHGDPERTREAVHPDHPTWTTTGDVGYVDADGFLHLTDRKAFMIISGGVNIYPQEVENALALHPKVHDVAVIGVPDEDFGEQVKAVVQPAPGIAPSPELAREIIDFTRSRIAHYKAPRSVDFVDELPRTPTGKLVKGSVKARYTR